MAWDIYKTFGQRTVLSHIRQKGWIKRLYDYFMNPFLLSRHLFPSLRCLRVWCANNNCYICFEHWHKWLHPQLDCWLRSGETTDIIKMSRIWILLRALAGCLTRWQALCSTSSRCCSSRAPTWSSTSSPWPASTTSPPSRTQVIILSFIQTIGFWFNLQNWVLTFKINGYRV